MTRSYPCLTELYNLFYSNGKKIIPIAEIWPFDFLTPKALAIFIMGDGYYKEGVGLCTDSFTLTEVIYLHHVLILKFDLDCRIFFHNSKTGTYRIIIKKKSLQTLQKLILPYMVKSMLYKLGL